MNGPARPVGEDDLQAYVDEFLDPVRRVAVEQYLRAHPDVAERVRADAAQRHELRVALAPFADGPLPSSLNVAMLVEARLLQRRRAPWRVAAAVALAAMAGAAGGWFLGRDGAIGGGATGVQLLAEEAAASYAVYTVDARRPVELWAAQQEDLTRWLSTRLRHPLAAPDLASVGYQLLGGRLVPTVHGPAAMFMYENEARSRLIVFVRPMTTPRSTPIEQVDAGTLDGCAWIDQGLGYSVVAREPAGRILELSRHVRQQTDGRG